MWRQAVVIKSAVPIWIRHKDCKFRGDDDQSDTKPNDKNVPLRCAYRTATLDGLLRAVPLILTTFPTRFGNIQPAARLCIAPMEDPTLA